ncbi:hypothetical protein [Clostridium botulinum]|nr:hypothetical protein [Clostridium botulinum]APQ72382.1 hypothetical protein RSJ9_2816 [Clostridium botulinum]MCR1166900.1 hypothetical protein [Clostridium botulinum]MCS4455785.1 hypothetical protein [Clostridium botulinum]MCS4468620.1 hypothetical protein [Clostridium botulinum]QGT45317.1 hypothetical protein GJ703_03598 [Clostridium botulinum]
MRIPVLRLLKRLYIIKIGKNKKILNIKFGEFSLEGFKIISMEKPNKVLTLEKYYKNHRTNDNLKEKLDNIIRTSIYLELY